MIAPVTLAAPAALWLLLLPGAALAWTLAGRGGAPDDALPRIRRGETGVRGARLLREGPAGRGARRRRLRPWLWIGVCLAIAALSRPQWGRIDEATFDQSREIIVALDLSRSMLSTDVRPSRLERSKLLVQGLLDRLKGERVGLILFSGTAFLQSPLSADYEILRDFLPQLSPDTMPEGGTNYSALIDTALDSFSEGSEADRFLIILSDGEATEEDWRSRVPELARRGIRVIGLGVGTEAGSMIPDGQGAFLKDDAGAVVMSHLESGTLRELAQATHGTYRNATGWIDLSALVQDTVARGRSGAFVEHRAERLAERFQWLLAPALFCLLMSLWREFPARPSARSLTLQGALPGRGGPAATAPAPAAASAALSVLLILSLCSLAHPSCRADEAAAPAGDDPGAAAADLSHLVGRLSSAPDCTADQWASLARQTTRWAGQVQSQGTAVPAGPVRDGLAAVDAGEAIDRSAADWPSLRSGLRVFLKEPPKPPQKKDSSDKDKDRQKNSGSQGQSGAGENSDSRNKASARQGSAPRGGSSPGSGQAPGGRSSPGKQVPAQGQAGRGTPSRGDDSGRAPGNPESGQASDGSDRDAGTQMVGGYRNPRRDPAVEQDPSLAESLEKYDLLRDQDSPAELFKLMRRDDPTPPPSKGKNW